MTAFAGYPPASGPNSGYYNGAAFHAYKYSGLPDNGIAGSAIGIYDGTPQGKPGLAIRGAINDLQAELAILNGVTNCPPVLILKAECVYESAAALFFPYIIYTFTPGDINGQAVPRTDDSGTWQLLDPV